MLLVNPLFSLLRSILKIYPLSTNNFNCLRTIRSDNLVSFANVRIEVKQDHVVRFAYCNNALCTLTALGDNLDAHIFL